MAVFIPYMIIVSIPVIIVCEFAILIFYSSGYSMDLPLMFMFATASIPAISYSLHDWLWASQDKHSWVVLYNFLRDMML